MRADSIDSDSSAGGEESRPRKVPPTDRTARSCPRLSVYPGTARGCAQARLRSAYYLVRWSYSRFIPANVVSEGLAATNAKQYSFFVRN